MLNSHPLPWSQDLFPDFYSQNMTGIRVEQTVFGSFVREISPQVHAHFSELGVPLEMLSTQWFLCLFVNVLPAATLLRVWDVMMWEGPSVLLRAGAALLHYYREAVLSTTDFHTISQVTRLSDRPPLAAWLPPLLSLSMPLPPTPAPYSSSSASATICGTPMDCLRPCTTRTG